jgi:hypothetical protein
MYIEEALQKRNSKPVEKVGFELDREFTLKIVGSKTQVFQRLVGCVFIGSNGEASQYVAQQRVKQAVTIQYKHFCGVQARAALVQAAAGHLTDAQLVEPAAKKNALLDILGTEAL